MANIHIYDHSFPFETESGETIKNLKIAYTCSGKINQEASNVVWICHAFTADACPESWWSGMVGKGKFFSPEKYLIICANIIGSPYGSTSPLDINPDNGKPYYHTFPLLTVRDLVHAHIILSLHLKINKIKIIIGGSIGGYQALEWSIMQPKMIEYLILIASSAQISVWRRAHNATQRMIIESDSSFYNNSLDGGLNGMKAARAMALLSYRNAKAYELTQAETDSNKLNSFKVDSYQRYQGEKLSKRFNAYSYYALLNMLDTHDVARNRNGLENALKQIEAKTLIISIDSDILFPTEDQEVLRKYISKANFKIIHSDYGHDGFLLENEQISSKIKAFLEGFN